MSEGDQGGNGSVYNDVTERYCGKVQFLRLEHGYIRTKTKINGIRDITFYYKDLDDNLKDLLILGSVISFEIMYDEKGKITAKSIKLIELPKEDQNHSAQDCPSVRFENDSYSMSSENDESGSQSSLRRDSVSSIIRTPASMQLYLQNHNHFDIEKESIKEQGIEFDDLVNHFLERVISRNYDSTNTSCWLF